MSFTKCLSNVLMQIRQLLSKRLLQLQTFLTDFHQLMLSCNRSPWVHGLSSTEGFKFLPFCAALLLKDYHSGFVSF